MSSRQLWKSQKYASIESGDGGQYSDLYEQGTNLALAPIDFYLLTTTSPQPAIAYVTGGATWSATTNGANITIETIGGGGGGGNQQSAGGGEYCKSVVPYTSGASIPIAIGSGGGGSSGTGNNGGATTWNTSVVVANGGQGGGRGSAGGTGGDGGTLCYNGGSGGLRKPVFVGANGGGGGGGPLGIGGAGGQELPGYGGGGGGWATAADLLLARNVGTYVGGNGRKQSCK